MKRAIGFTVAELSSTADTKLQRRHEVTMKPG
jgi:hypothetical protein